MRSIHPADEVLGVAKALAAEIATNAAPVSAAVSRGLLWRMLGEGHPMAAHRADSEAIFDLGRKPDAREGVMAFLEKRPPAWIAEPDQGPPADLPVVGQPDLRRRLSRRPVLRSIRPDRGRPRRTERRRSTLNTAFTMGQRVGNGLADT